MTVLARGVGALMVLAVLAPARAEDDQADVCRKIVDGLARQDIEAVVPLMALTAWTPAIREDGKAKIRQTLSVISRHMGGDSQSRHPIDLSTPGKSIVGELWRYPKGTLAFGCTRIRMSDGWHTELAYDTDTKKMADQLVQKIAAAKK